MKIGINLWVWSSPHTTAELEKYAPIVKRMGFDMIEVAFENIGDLDCARGAKILRDAGLGVSAGAAMGPDRDLIHPDKSIRDNGMSYIRACIENTAELGATNLIGPMYSSVGRCWQQTPSERAADVRRLVEQLSALSEHAASYNVNLCVEPLNRFETSFLNTVRQMIEVIDAVNHPSCGILLDTFHMNIEEKNLGDAIRLAGKRVKHIHACENDRGAPGSGNVDWSSVAHGLHDIGYDGPVVIESFTDKVKTIARAAAIWRAFEPSQDALAENGLWFLRSLLQQR
jgi:D-psicose/D-tagatose/L-ribulose 3-epimerase